MGWLYIYHNLSTFLKSSKPFVLFISDMSLLVIAKSIAVIWFFLVSRKCMLTPTFCHLILLIWRLGGFKSDSKDSTFAPLIPPDRNTSIMMRAWISIFSNILIQDRINIRFFKTEIGPIVVWRFSAAE